MQFLIPYLRSGRALPRPIVPLRIIGPADDYPSDGLLDTGADWTILPLDVAERVGIGLDPSSPRVPVGSALGQVIECAVAQVVLELRRERRALAWRASVLIAPHGFVRVHWGYRGFLEFFRATFDGPRQQVLLSPTRNMPRVRL